VRGAKLASRFMKQESGAQLPRSYSVFLSLLLSIQMALNNENQGVFNAILGFVKREANQGSRECWVM